MWSVIYWINGDAFSVFILWLCFGTDCAFHLPPLATLWSQSTPIAYFVRPSGYPGVCACEFPHIRALEWLRDVFKKYVLISTYTNVVKSILKGIGWVDGMRRCPRNIDSGNKSPTSPFKHLLFLTANTEFFFHLSLFRLGFFSVFREVLFDVWIIFN